MIDYNQTIAIKSHTSTIYSDTIYTYNPTRQKYRPLSLAYFCTDCGNLWARITRSMEGKLAKWMVINVICEDCSKLRSNWPLYPLGGSIYNVYDGLSQIDSWSFEVLEREVLLLLDNWSKSYE